MKHWSWWKFFSVVIFVIFVSFFSIASVVVQRLSQRAVDWNQRFAAASSRSVVSLFPELIVGFWSGQKSSAQAQTWLILGTDEVQGSGRETILTDTIMVAHYDPNKNTVKLLSLPRDIYHPSWNSKINMLYWTALQTGSSQPQEVVQQQLETFTGLQFTKALVVRIADIQSLVDRVGGVEIDVPQAFTDERYPRSGVDVTKERDPAILYETLVFTNGPQNMDGERAVKYMRSRHSSLASEAGDEARVRRQQEVIAALVQKLARQDIVLYPTLLGSLFDWYSDRFSQDVSLTELGALFGQIAQSGAVPTLEKVVLPVADLPLPVDQTTLFIHPPETKYRQWVYEMVDPTGESFRSFIQTQLVD